MNFFTERPLSFIEFDVEVVRKFGFMAHDRSRWKSLTISALKASLHLKLPTDSFWQGIQMVN